LTSCEISNENSNRLYLAADTFLQVVRPHQPVDMAPTAPKKRPSIRTKISKSGSSLISRLPPIHHKGAIIDDGFLSSKKDKRTIKHSAFVNRIEKAHKKPLKRRRPSKKLVTTLEGLADALPGDEGEVQVEGGKIRQRSLKSRPGATKRREKVERMERERFGKNMTQLAAGSGASAMGIDGTEGPQPSATVSRWAVLRGFISQTIEQKEEFRTR